MTKVKYDIVVATAEHGEYVANNMRSADVAEVFAVDGGTSRDAVFESLKNSSEAYTGLADGIPIAMFGIAPTVLLSDNVCMWALSTNAAEQHKKAFMLGSKAFVDAVKKDYPVISNFVDARYTRAIRWLKWLGFTVYPAAPFGPNKALFHYIELRT